MSEPEQGPNKRRTERKPIELQVEYKRLNTFFSDYTKNISKGGTFIKTKNPLDVGTVFVFRLLVPSLGTPFELRGVVKWTQETGNEPGMGIEFVFESEESRRALQETVEKLMSESIGQRG
jgi:type IV pilus assembly protein PilZ